MLNRAEEARKLIKLRIEIENTYTDEAYADDPELDDNGTITVVKDVEVTEPPEGEDSDEYDEWKHLQIICHTGTGRELGDAYYDVTVLATSDPERIPVGMTWDAGY